MTNQTQLGLTPLKTRTTQAFFSCVSTGPRDCKKTPSGREYQGTTNITVTGSKCKKWSESKAKYAALPGKKQCARYFFSLPVSEPNANSRNSNVKVCRGVRTFVHGNIFFQRTTAGAQKQTFPRGAIPPTRSTAGNSALYPCAQVSVSCTLNLWKGE